MLIKQIKTKTPILTGALFGALLLFTPALQAQKEWDLPKPDGKEANMSDKVKVFVIMGQSNTLEMGKVSPDLKEAYPFLADGDGWSVRKDVKNVSVMQKRGNMNVYRNDWLTISGNKIGIEIGIGHQLGNAIDEPVMILKSSIGNRSLGWDLLPPSVGRYEYNGEEQPGYGETYPGKKDRSKIVKFEEGGDMLGWYAGKQYDDDVRNAKKILEDLEKYYPGAKGYEVAGFLWWQGDKDMRNPAHFNNYRKHLEALHESLKKDFDAPNAPMVVASLGQTDESDESSGHGIILQAMKDYAKNSDVGFVYTKPLLDQPSSSSGHYGGNAKTYMNVGLAMGEAMTELVK